MGGRASGTVEKWGKAHQQDWLVSVQTVAGTEKGDQLRQSCLVQVSLV